ncbi:tyrosine-type recombinase/integrase [Agathobaculum butyriciproducens]|uniref:tyrosine-type recombinase/integrase n=1 Tax=Agathobaculum TaxID=2048137 RepID=UPI002097E5B6|nr:tyrosine-type recombinase/integrase [Agathobaculum butyriciproducens]
MLLTDAAKEFEFNCQCRKLSDKTIRNYGKLIGYLLDYLKEQHKVLCLEDVRPMYIKAYLMMLQERGAKPQYINDQLKAFKVLFRYLYEEGYTDSILTERIKNVKQPKTIIKTFTEQEVKKMTEYYSGHTFMEVRNRLMLMTFFDTGIRVSELIDLKLSQVKDEYILIHGKGDKERVVPKSPLLNKWMFKYLSTRENFFAYRRVPENVFLSRNGRPMTTEAIHRVIKIAGKAVGVSRDIRVSPHTCRHTFAQMQLKNGLDLYSLSRLMGHSSISITQRYLEGLRDFEVLNACKATGILMNL